MVRAEWAKRRVEMRQKVTEEGRARSMQDFRGWCRVWILPDVE